MVQINNLDLLKKARDDLKINIEDSIPQDISKDIQLVFDVSGKTNVITRGANKTSSGSGTLYSTPTTGDFYITSASLAYSKDAACDTATGYLALQIVINGATQNLLVLPVITLTAQSLSIALSFPTPIKVDKNSNIIYGGTFTAGTYTRAVSITGYILE